jgi:uncharacterized protein (DUF952 family)
MQGDTKSHCIASVLSIPETAFRVQNRFRLDQSRNARHLNIMLVYKILRSDEWNAFQAAGKTSGAPIDLQDRFIHFSAAHQAAETAAKHFSGANGLRLLACGSDGFGEALKWEPSRGGDLFPHLYTHLKITDVLWTKPLPCIDGQHQFPKEMT